MSPGVIDFLAKLIFQQVHPTYFILSLRSFSGEVKPALSAPEGSSDPLPSVASPEKIPYFRDQLLSGKAGAPCISIGLATMIYLTYRFPNTVSHSPTPTVIDLGIILGPCPIPKKNYKVLTWLLVRPNLRRITGRWRGPGSFSGLIISS